MKNKQNGSETPSTGVERDFIRGKNTTQVRLLELDLPPRGETVLSLLSFFLSFFFSKTL